MDFRRIYTFKGTFCENSKHESKWEKKHKKNIE